MLSTTKRLVAAAKFLVAATKNLFVVPNFVAVTKPFFFRVKKNIAASETCINYSISLLLQIVRYFVKEG